MDPNAKYFQDRATRLQAMPEHVRTNFQAAMELQGDKGESWLDRKIVATHLADKEGLDRDEVEKNWEGYAPAYGLPADPGEAWNHFSEFYKSQDGRKMKAAYNPRQRQFGESWLRQAPRIATAGGGEVGAGVPEGILRLISNTAAVAGEGDRSTALGLARMMDLFEGLRTKEIQELGGQQSIAKKYGLDESNAARVEREIERAGDNTYRQFMKAYSDVSGAGADWFQELREEMNEFYGVDEEYSNSFVGQLIRAGAQMPAYSAMLLTGAPGIGLMTSYMFGLKDAERRETQGDEYDRSSVVPYISALVSSYGEAKVESLLGLERFLRGRIAALKIVDDPMEKLTLKEFGKRFAKRSVTGLEEGLEEVIQGRIDALSKKVGYDATQQLFSGEEAEQMLLEFALGAILGTVYSQGLGALTDIEGNYKRRKYITGRSGPLSSDEFKMLGNYANEEQILGSVEDPAMARLLLRGSQGDEDAQVLYNANLTVQSEAFNEEGKFKGLALVESDGQLMVVDGRTKQTLLLDTENEEHRALVENIKARAEADAVLAGDNGRVIVPEGQEPIKRVVMVPDVGTREITIGAAPRIIAPTTDDGTYGLVTGEEKLGEFATEQEALAAQAENIESQQAQFDADLKEGMDFFSAFNEGVEVIDKTDTWQKFMDRVKELDMDDVAARQFIIDMTGQDPDSPEGMQILERQIVAGESQSQFRDNVWTDVVRFFKSASYFTIVEEFSESYIKRAVSQYGTATYDDIRGWKAEYESQTGLKEYGNSEDALIEWFSNRAIDYVSMEQLDGTEETMPTGFRRFFMMVRQYIHHVVRRAAILKNLQLEGKLNPELEAHLRMATGHNPQYIEGQVRATEIDDSRPTMQTGTDTPAFSNFFGDSKVVNPDGTPKILYHGTGMSFEEFGKGKAVGGMHPTRSLGYFFTHLRSDARWYSENAWSKAYGPNRTERPEIMELYVRIEKPYLISSRDFYNIDDPDKLRDLKYRLEQGKYDGIFVLSEGADALRLQAWDPEVPKGEVIEYVALKPEQIKSATGNTGAWDPNNPNITMQTGTAEVINPDGPQGPRIEFAHWMKMLDGTYHPMWDVIEPWPQMGYNEVDEELRATLSQRTLERSGFRFELPFIGTARAVDEDYPDPSGEKVTMQVGAKEPKKKRLAYKLFVKRDGKLYPLFVGAKEEVPVGKWVQAVAGERTKDGKVKSKLGPLAYRPGWHSGDLPIAPHIGLQPGRARKPMYRPKEHVWALVEVSDDVDWQTVADSRASMHKQTGKPIARTAHITDQVPLGGHYRYKTNSNMEGEWIISGEMKVIRELDDKEVAKINKKAGVADLPREPKDYAPGQRGIAITVAPLRTDNMKDMTTKEMAKRVSSAKYLHLQQVITEIAEAYGVNIIMRSSHIGTWVEYDDKGEPIPSIEVPETIEIKTQDMDKAKEIAALIAASAPELQNSGMLKVYDEKGTSTEVSFKAKGADQALALLAGLKAVGLSGSSYDPKTRIFKIAITEWDDVTLEDVKEFTVSANDEGLVQAGTFTAQAIQAEFIEEAEYRSYIKSARSKADKVRGPRGERRRQLIDRAERRVDRYEESVKWQKKAVKALKGMSVPVTSAKAIEKELGPFKGTFPSIRQLGQWLDGRFEEKNGFRKYEIGSAEGLESAAESLEFDILDGLSVSGSGMGWYDDRIHETILEIGRVWPELVQNPEEFAVMIGIMAATSQGYTVTQNFGMSAKVFEYYKKNGKLPEEWDFANAKAAILGNFKKINELIDEYGLNGYAEFMDSEVTGRTLRDDYGLQPDGVTLDQTVRGNRIMGPKIGSFFNNMRGRFDTITMDLWFTRSMYRYLGDSVIPNESERAQVLIERFREAFEAAPRQWGYTEADIDTDDKAMVVAAEIFRKWGQAKNMYNPTGKGGGFKKYKDGNILEAIGRTMAQEGTMKAAPGTKENTDYFEAIVRLAQEKLKARGFDLTFADLQAILWYREKNLFKEAGKASSTAEPADYLDAAMKLKRDLNMRTFQTGTLEDPTLGMDPDPEYMTDVDEQFDKLRREQLERIMDKSPESQRKSIRKELTIAGQARRLVGDWLVPTSSRLIRMNAAIGHRLRKMEFEKIYEAGIYKQRVIPFLEKLSLMSEDDQKVFKVAIMNSDKALTEGFIKQYGMEAEWKETRKVLEEIRQRYRRLGYDIGSIEDYFPRKVLDYSDLLKEMTGKDYDELSILLAERELEMQKKKMEFTEEDKNRVATNWLKGRASKFDKKPSSAKERKIDDITEWEKHYANPAHALFSHIEDATRIIAENRFFGKDGVWEEVWVEDKYLAEKEGVETMMVKRIQYKKLNLKDSVGNYLLEARSKGQISIEQAEEIKRILTGYFSYTMSSAFIRSIKSAGYITLMSNFGSALTQFGDLYGAIYEGGLANTLGSVGKSIGARDQQITRENMGLERMGAEFERGDSDNLADRLAKGVEITFKATGLTIVDALGKESITNSTMMRIRDQAATGKLSARNKERIVNIFGADSDAVVKKLAEGVKDDPDIMLLAFNILSDWQPATRAEMPLSYQENPNGRLLYTLKSFTIRMLDAFRRESWDEIRRGNKLKGATQLLRLAFIFWSINMPVDWIKDFIYNRRSNLSDIMVDNLWKLVGLTRYQIYYMKEKPGPEGAAKLAFPPLPWVELPMTDLVTWREKVAKGENMTFDDFESVRMIPFFGKELYWWAGRGDKKIDDRLAREQGTSID